MIDLFFCFRRAVGRYFFFAVKSRAQLYYFTRETGWLGFCLRRDIADYIPVLVALISFGGGGGVGRVALMAILLFQPSKLLAICCVSLEIINKFPLFVVTWLAVLWY